MQFDFMETNETSLDLFDYSIRIMGEAGVGKTSLFHSLVTEFAKETGNKNIGILLPLELGYTSLNGLNIFKLTDPKTGLKKDTLTSWKEVKQAVDTLVMAKKQDPNFPIKIVGIDTTTRLEKYGMKEVENIHLNETGVRKNFNATYGGYGAGHSKLKAMLTEDIIDKLRNAGFIPYYISHSRTKQKKTRTTGEEYSYVGSATGEGFDSVILDDCDFSLAYALERTIINKQEVVGDRVIKLRNDEEFKGAKARFQDVPNEFKAGSSANETAEIFINIFKKAVKSASGIKDDVVLEAKKVEQITEHKKKEEVKIESLKQEDAQSEDNIIKSKLIAWIESSITRMDDSAVQWLNDLKPSYQEAIKASDMGTIGQIMTYLGYDVNGN
jgi:hypothetical protein